MKKIMLYAQWGCRDLEIYETVAQSTKEVFGDYRFVEGPEIDGITIMLTDLDDRMYSLVEYWKDEKKPILLFYYC